MKKIFVSLLAMAAAAILVLPLPATAACNNADTSAQTITPELICTLNGQPFSESGRCSITYDKSSNDLSCDNKTKNNDALPCLDKENLSEESIIHQNNSDANNININKKNNNVCCDLDWLQVILEYLSRYYAADDGCHGLLNSFFQQLELYLANDLNAVTPDTYRQDTLFTVDDTAMEVLLLVNEARLQAGLKALEPDMGLFAAAAIRAEEIQQQFSHTRPDGTSCFTVLTEVEYRLAGENIALGQTTAQQVFTDWMNSEGHRENIMKADFGRIGLAAVPADNQHGYAWVQIFAD